MGNAESRSQPESFNAFVGRERELAELRAGVGDALAGSGRLFLISGEPGIGKTRLAGEISRDAVTRGMRVMWGRCWEGGGAPAYWPFVQVLRALVRGVHPNDLLAKLGPHAHEIARMLPELYPEPAPESSSHLDPEQARFRLFDAVATVVKSSAHSHPLLMIIDDLHDADEPSVQMLTFVARALKNEPNLIIGTYRDLEVRRSPGLLRLIGDLRREGIEISLSGLDQTSVASLIERRFGLFPSERMAAELHSATAGNPLFVDGAMRMLVAEGRLGNSAQPDEYNFKLPASVRETIRRRIEALPDSTRSILSTAAVFGNEFELWPLAQVAELSAGQALESLDEAMRAGVVMAISHERFRFAHALIRREVYDGLGPAERVQMHGRIAEALEERHQANLGPHLAELAHHFREAGIVGKAIDYLIRAGDEARRVFAHEHAVSPWSTALELVEEFGGDRRLYAVLHLRLGELMGAQGAGAERLKHMEEALRAYEELGDARGAAEVHLALGNNLSISLGGVQDIPLAAEHLRRAEAVLSQGPEDSRLAMLYLFVGHVAARSCRARDAIAALRRSMEIAARIGQMVRWAQSAARLSSVLPQTGEIAEALELLQQVWSKLDAFNVPGTAFGAVWAAGACPMALWDPRGAQKWWATELEKPRLARGQRKMFMRSLQDAYLLAGDLPNARNLLTQAPHASAAGGLAFYEGDWEHADSILEQGFEHARSATPGEMVLYGQALARVRRIRGEPARAETLLRQVLALYSDEEPHCQIEMLVRPELALVCLEVGRLEDAAAEVSRCREVSAGEDWRGLSGHLARAEAAVAAAAGKFAEAVTSFESAVEIFRKYTLPWEEADTLQRWGQALLAAGAPDRAIEKFDAATEVYESHGAGTRWIERVEIDRKRAESTPTAEAPAPSELVPHHNGVTATEGASSAPIAAYSFRREAEYWTIGYEGQSFRLKDSKGLAYIAHLLHHPAVEFHVIELASVIGGGEQIETPASRDQMWDLRMTPSLGDAGAMLDLPAKAAYKRRLDELREELAEAREFNDPGRAEKAEEEIEFLTRELARAVGLSGRDRKAASHVERSRVKVTKAIRGALSHIVKACPELGRQLEATIKTGEFCVYTPDSHRLSPSIGARSVIEGS